MQRKTLLVWAAVCAVTIVACSGTPHTPVSPSATEPSTTFVNPDGSTMKVTAPRDLAPNGRPVDTRKPTLTFTNAAGRLVQLNLGHEIEIQDASGTVVYTRVAGESVSSSSHAVETDMAFGSLYWWRVRARFGEQFGPWSDFATFQTPEPPPPPPPPPPVGGGGGSLTFPVPAECGPFGPDNRLGCALAVAAQSAEWRACAGGRGVGCHRFTRQVVYALSQSDPNWKLIQAAPGGHSCNCFGCGGSDGSMFREDTTVYGGRRVYDMITGAGGPSPSVSWSFIGDGGPRPGDQPRDAPLCTP